MATQIDSATPFASQRELLHAARGLAGRTLAELAANIECELPVEPLRNKGFIGRMVERSLGLKVSPPSAADFAELGVELKTLPVSQDWRPRESTFVCYVALASLLDTTWEDSRVAHKLSRVLFVPVESAAGLAFGQRRIGSAFLWSPSLEEAALLQADYAEIAGRAAAGDLDMLDARVGRVMQLRPKAAHGRVRVRVSDGDGAPSWAQPRAFYLRAGFTAEVLCAALRHDGR